MRKQKAQAKDSEKKDVEGATHAAAEVKDGKVVEAEGEDFRASRELVSLSELMQFKSVIEQKT